MGLGDGGADCVLDAEEREEPVSSSSVSTWLLIAVLRERFVKPDRRNLTRFGWEFQRKNSLGAKRFTVRVI